MLPRQGVPIADGSMASNAFYAFLQDVERAINDGSIDTTGLRESIAAIARALGSPDGSVGKIPPQSDGGGQIQGLDSILTFGALPNMVQLALDGDAQRPGPTFRYGTDADGVKGWFPVSDALAGSDTATLTVGADGVVTFSLPELPNAGGGTLQKAQRDQYGRLAGTSDATTTDLPEGSNLYHTAERVDARITAAKADPDGIASLSGGKLDAGQLPALAITETFVVNTEAAMLALDCQQGDVAVRSDLQKSFILTAEPASALANWQELLVPTGVGVASFNGRTGTVTPQSGDYTAAQVGAATAAQGAKADSAVQGDDSRLTNSREWTASTVTQAEAEAGTVTTRRAWTAQRVRQAIAAWWAGSAAKTMLDGLVVQTIADGDTTHAPSGDAVFDALAGKANLSGGNTFVGDQAFHAGIYYPDQLRIMASTVDDADTARLVLAGGGGASNARGAYIIINGNENAITPGRLTMVATGGADIVQTTVSGSSVRPANDGIVNSGSAGYRWNDVFSLNSANNTSDARLKTAPRDLTHAELACAADLASLPCIFQWLHAIEAKGEDARLHCSPTVQSVIAIMASHGLDPFRYGFVCYDEWDEQPEIRDEETGEVTQEHRPADDRYSLRPSELAHFVMRGLAHRQDELERRLTALESE